MRERRFSHLKFDAAAQQLPVICPFCLLRCSPRSIGRIKSCTPPVRSIYWKLARRAVEISNFVKIWTSVTGEQIWGVKISHWKRRCKNRTSRILRLLFYVVSYHTLWPSGTVPDVGSRGRAFEFRPRLLCTNANSACHPSWACYEYQRKLESKRAYQAMH